MYHLRKFYLVIAIFIIIAILVSIVLITVEINKNQLDNRSKASINDLSSLKVLTYNLGGITSWTTTKQTEVTDFLYTQNADVVLLQEIRSSDINNRPLVYLQNIINNLSQKGLSYGYWYVDRTPGFLVNQAGGGYIGQAILSKYALPSTERTLITVNSDCGNVGTIKDYLMRQTISINNVDIYVFNYHPQLIETCKLKITEKTLTALQEVKSYPIILGGDFNMDRNYILYTELAKFLIDTCKPSGTVICTPSVNGTFQIDYIFYSKLVFFTDSNLTQTLNTVTMSNHFPVVTTLSYTVNVSSSQSSTPLSSSVSSTTIISSSHTSSLLASSSISSRSIVSSSSRSTSVSTSSSINPLSKYNLISSNPERIDISDFAVFVTHYRKTGVCGNIADFNGDCKVDISDFAMFRVYYGRSY